MQKSILGMLNGCTGGFILGYVNDLGVVTGGIMSTTQLDKFKLSLDEFMEGCFPPINPALVSFRRVQVLDPSSTEETKKQELYVLCVRVFPSKRVHLHTTPTDVPLERCGCFVRYGASTRVVAYQDAYQWKLEAFSAKKDFDEAAHRHSDHFDPQNKDVSRRVDQLEMHQQPHQSHGSSLVDHILSAGSPRILRYKRKFSDMSHADDNSTSSADAEDGVAPPPLKMAKTA